MYLCVCVLKRLKLLKYNFKGIKGDLLGRDTSLEKLVCRLEVARGFCRILPREIAEAIFL